MLLLGTLSGWMQLLHEDLLSGRSVAVGGDPPDEIVAALSAHGARVEVLPDPVPADEEVGEWARARQPLHALVYSAIPAFGDGGPAALVDTMLRTWQAVRGVAVGALIEAQGPAKVVLVAPPAAAGPTAPAALAALENLTRTLSVEWARYGMTTVTVAPAPDTLATELGQLICFLCSPAGDYFSGCLLDLGNPAP